MKTPLTKKRLTKLLAKLITDQYSFRSGLEKSIAQRLVKMGVDFSYEEEKISYEVPTRSAKYTPDFILPNGIIIEAKGRFLTADRKKHLLIKDQHPDYDIRFVFSNSRQRISKTSKTTYAKWCESKGFLFADKEIPKEWINETKASS